MSYFKFGQSDIFYNTIEANPEYNYYIHSGTVYLDYLQNISGSYSDNITGVSKGHISLYEYNINRADDQRIFPFITKGGVRSTLRSVTDAEWNTSHGYGGEQISGEYNLSASITRIAVNTSSRKKIKALRNVLNHYAVYSPHYQYSSSFGNKETQDISLINIPAILYGSSIKKGSVCLKFYVSGAVVGELQDTRHNGELVQVAPYGSTGTGSIGGVVLYNEGLILLTGSWELDDKNRTYDGASDKAKWKYFGMGANDGSVIDNTNLSSSFSIEYKGVNRIQTINMFCHAKNGELNFSNNPTYLSGVPTYTTGSKVFRINQRKIKNILSSSYTDVEPDFKKTTYISKIAIYDDDKNLLGVAKIANPIRKTEDKQFTFKLKIDI